VIQNLKDEIERVSQKPLKRVQSKTEDELQMENIQLKLKQNEYGYRPGGFDEDECPE